jgi:hypothetical protein
MPMKPRAMLGRLGGIPLGEIDKMLNRGSLPGVGYRLPAIICAACCKLVSVTLAPESMRATS